MKKMMCYWWLFGDNHGNCSMIASSSVLPVGAVQWEVFQEENLSWIFVLRYIWIVYRVLDITFWEVHILWCCASFALHKVKKTCGGSRWKLRKLTHVRRFLAYVMYLQAPEQVQGMQYAGLIHSIGPCRWEPQLEKSCREQWLGCTAATWFQVTP
jgi:hypothetical protein